MAIDIEQWSDIGLANLYSKTPLVTVADTKYFDEVGGEFFKGKVINVYTYPDDGAEPADYDDNVGISLEKVQSSSVALTIDQVKEISIRVSKVDTIQNDANTLSGFLANKLAGHRRAVDKFLAGKIVTAMTVDNTNEIDLSTTQLTKDNIVSVFQQVRVAMKDANYDGECFIRIDNQTEAILEEANLINILKTENDGTVGPKTVKMFGDNLRLLPTTLVAPESGVLSFVFGAVDGGINFAAQLNSLEKFNPEKYFGEAVKGLMMYGGEVFDPKRVGVLKVQAYA